MGAHFSEDRTYRFALWRIWDLGKPMAMLIGLNPSTANESTSDPTIRRLQGRLGLMAMNGFGGFYMMNLFPFITPYPALLQTAKEQLPENDLYMQQVNLHCLTVIFCWGNFRTFGRDEKMMALFPRAMCFGKNQSGTPKHPLYLGGGTKLRDFV